MSALSRVFSLSNLLFLFSLWVPAYAFMGGVGISLSTLNVCTQIGVLVGCLGVASVRIATLPTCLWYPMTWFLLTSGLYYGFGPLLYYFGSPETVAYSDSYYPVTDASLWKVNIITLIGIGVVVAIYILLKSTIDVSAASKRYSLMREEILDSRFLWKVALIFLILGVPIKVFLVLPRALGIWNVVLPGSIEYFSVLSTLAVVPLFLMRGRGCRWAATALVALLCFELVTSFLQLSKLAILKVVIICMLALVLRGTTWKRLAVMGVLSLVAYGVILVPLVGHGRIAFNVMGLTKTSDAVALIDDVASGSAHDELAMLLPGVQGWWSRLNYAHAQAFAMDAHDAGQIGKTFELAVWIFIPRILYPEKPVSTSGDEFNELVVGNPESKSAPGMFAEGYWNAGWTGLVIVSVVMACCFWFWERYTQARIVSLQLQYLPVMWMGLFPAIQQDSWFVPGTLGIVPIAIVFHWLARLLVTESVPIGKLRTVTSYF
jgi:hypothetical protein